MDSAQRPVRIIGTVQDITERRGLEEQLRQAMKMEAIGRLAGGVAHDFNNLLTIIMGCSGLIEGMLPIEDPLCEMAKEISAAGERAASLTRQLLAFSRKQVLQPRVLDVNVELQSIEKILRRLISEAIDLRITLDSRARHLRLIQARSRK